MTEPKILNHHKWAMDVINSEQAEGYMYGWQIKQLFPEYFEHHKLKANKLYKVV